jgi:hypothetical protein
MPVAGDIDGKRSGGGEIDAEFSLGSRRGEDRDVWSDPHVAGGVWVVGEDPVDEPVADGEGQESGRWGEVIADGRASATEDCQACGDESAIGGSTDMRPVAVEVVTDAGAIAAVLDTACFSIWVDKSRFLSCGGYNFNAGGSAAAADAGALNVAGDGQLDFALWGRRFKGQRVRVMTRLPAIMLIGRQFM